MNICDLMLPQGMALYRIDTETEANHKQSPSAAAKERRLIQWPSLLRNKNNLTNQTFFHTDESIFNTFFFLFTSTSNCSNLWLQLRPNHKRMPQPAEFLDRARKTVNGIFTALQIGRAAGWNGKMKDPKHLMTWQTKLPCLGINKSPLTWDILSRCLASSLSLAFWKWACSFSSPGVSKYLSTASGVLAAVVGTEVKFWGGEREGRGRKAEFLL